MKSKPSLSVIVATYHRDENLTDTLRDLLAQDYPGCEIIVVDQDPVHDTVTHNLLHHWHQEGKIEWMRTSHPSLTAARNIGIKRAAGEIIVFVDDDVHIPDSGFLESHAEPFIDNSSIGASAGRVLVPGQEPRKVRHHIGWLGYSGAREPGFGSEFSAMAYSVRGCNMAFRRSAIYAVGGFDERYNHSAFREDTDISLRLRRLGYLIWFNHRACLYHLSASKGGTRDQSIAVDTDLILNDSRFALFNLLGLHQCLWLLRLYASRVIKAGLQQGGVFKRHQSFWHSYLGARKEQTSTTFPRSLS